MLRADKIGQPLFYLRNFRPHDVFSMSQHISYFFFDPVTDSVLLGGQIKRLLAGFCRRPGLLGTAPNCWTEDPTQG